MSVTATQSVKVSEDIKQELENMDNASEFIRSAIREKLAQDKLENLDEKIKEIDLESKKESFAKMSEEFPSTDNFGAPNSPSVGNSQLIIEEQFPAPEHYDKKIEQYENELEELKVEREKVESEKDKILLERAIHPQDSSSPKNHFEQIKKNLEKINEKIEDKRALIERLQDFKSEVKEKHQERKKLQNKIAAEKIKNELLEPILNKLDTSYEQFAEQFNYFQKIRKQMSIRVSRAGGNRGSRNTLRFESRMSRDIGIGDSGFGSSDLQEKHLRDILPYPRLGSIPEYESD